MAKPNAGLVPEDFRLDPNPIFDSYRPVFVDVFSPTFDSIFTLDQYYIPHGASVTEDDHQAALGRLSLALHRRVPRRKSHPPIGKMGLRLLEGVLPGMKNGNFLAVSGPIGSGKSTFLTATLRNYACQMNLLKPLQFVHIDFCKADREDLLSHDKLLAAMGQQVLAHFAVALEEEKQRRDEMILTDHPLVSEQYRRLCDAQAISPAQKESERRALLDSMHQQPWDVAEWTLRYIKMQYGGCILFVDNSDQLHRGTIREIYDFCLTVYSRTEVLLIVALRDYTYRNMKGHLMAGTRLTWNLSVSHPPVHAVLDKRFQLVQRSVLAIAKRDPTLRTRSYDLGGKEITVTPEGCGLFLSAITRSLLQDKALSALVTSLSNGSLRRAIEIVYPLVSSGHIDSSDLMPQQYELGRGARQREPIRYHAFVKSIMLGNYSQYFAGKSILVNLFDYPCRGEVPCRTLLPLRVLKYIVGQDGWIWKNSLVDRFSELGYSSNDVHQVLDRFAGYDSVLIDCYEGPDVEAMTSFAATEAAKAYLVDLVGHFRYLQHVRDDCDLGEDYRSIPRAISSSLRSRVAAAWDFVEELAVRDARDIRQWTATGGLEAYMRTFGAWRVGTFLGKAMHDDIQYLVAAQVERASDDGQSEGLRGIVDSSGERMKAVGRAYEDEKKAGTRE